jgi:hypothetical protein
MPAVTILELRHGNENPYHPKYFRGGNLGNYASPKQAPDLSLELGPAIDTITDVARLKKEPLLATLIEDGARHALKFIGSINAALHRKDQAGVVVIGISGKINGQLLFHMCIAPQKKIYCFCGLTFL